MKSHVKVWHFYNKQNKNWDFTTMPTWLNKYHIDTQQATLYKTLSFL